MSVPENNYPIASTEVEVRRFGIDDVRVVRAFKKEGAAKANDLATASAMLTAALEARIQIGLERRTSDQNQLLTWVKANRGVL